MTVLTMPEHEWLTIREVAQELRCSEPTVRRRIRTGGLPAVQLGGPRSAVRVKRSELEAWLTQDRPSYHRSRGGAMKATGSGVNRRELELIKKTLRRNPGCSIRMTRGTDGAPNVRLDRASRLAQLRGRVRRADLLLLEAEADERYRRVLSR